MFREPDSDVERYIVDMVVASIPDEGVWVVLVVRSGE